VRRGPQAARHFALVFGRKTVCARSPTLQRLSLGAHAPAGQPTTMRAAPLTTVRIER